MTLENRNQEYNSVDPILQQHRTFYPGRTFKEILVLIARDAEKAKIEVIKKTNSVATLEEPFLNTQRNCSFMQLDLLDFALGSPVVLAEAENIAEIEVNKKTNSVETLEESFLNTQRVCSFIQLDLLDFALGSPVVLTEAENIAEIEDTKNMEFQLSLAGTYTEGVVSNGLMHDFDSYDGI